MSILKSVFIISLIIIVSIHKTYSQPARSLINDSYTYVKSNLEFLTSDELEGREVASRGEKIAALFISQELEKYGVLPYGDSGGYFQDFNVKVINYSTDSKVSIINDDSVKSFPNGNDVIYSSRSLPNEKFSDKEFDVIFAGYGIVSEKDNYNSYQNIDVENKIVAVLKGTPKKDGEEILDKKVTNKFRRSIRTKSELAQSKGAVGLMVLPDEETLKYWEYLQRGANTKLYKLDEEFNSEFSDKDIPILYLNEISAEYLFSKNMKEFESIKNLESPSLKTFTLGNRVSFGYEIIIQNKKARNIIGFIKGKDESYKNEYITIGAHYDHEGIKNGRIYNGADDNGSGTVTVLEVARRLALNKINKRPVLVIFHTGEEKGLKGAKFLTNNSPFIDSAMVHINVDMVGRKSEDSIYCIGASKISSQLGEIVKNVNSRSANFVLDYKFDNPNDPQRLYYRSDHVHYARRGIPIVFFYDYMKADYHKPTDTIDKINFTKIVKMTDLIYNLSLELSNLNERLVLDENILN